MDSLLFSNPKSNFKSCTAWFSMLFCMNVCLCVGNGRPRGRVVKGVYVVHPKKTVDQGVRRKRRPRRDLGGWRRSAIGPMDPYFRTAVQAIAPSPAYPSRDPRRQSRFLGHVIDGTLGWVTDVVHHVPLVGPLVGHPLRMVCRVVRSGENAINSLTGTVGVHLFVLAILSCLCPATAVSNCCTPDQVVYCTEVTCVHETGCIICEQKDDQVVCWSPAGLLVSHPPNYTGIDPFLTQHIDFVAGTTFICDLTGMREVCGVAVLLSATALELLPRPVKLNTTADCYLFIDSGVDPLFASFFTWLAEEFSTITAILDFISKVPSALAHAFTRSHFLTMCSIAGLALNGNMAKAFALVVLYIEAAAAAPMSVESLKYPELGAGCPLLSRPPRCGNRTSFGSTIYCFHPKFGFQQSSQGWPQGSWFCAGAATINSYTNLACCTLRVTPAFCHNCSSDCSWADKRQTFEVCGASPAFSTACAPNAISALASVLPTIAPRLPNQTCMPTVVAGLSIGPLKSPGPASYVSLVHGSWITYHYYPHRLAKLDYKHWARLPGTPPTYRGSWMTVPKGMYSSRKDISSGLVIKDRANQDYQLLFSGVGTYIIPGITEHVVIIALLAAFGARWCLFLYAMYNWLPGAFAFTPEVIAATAASPWEDPVVRAGVYFASLWRSPLSIPLCGNLISFILLSFAHYAQAFSTSDILFAAGSVTLFTAWAGLFSRFIPMLLLTQSYLRVRLEAFTRSWLDRSLLFVCVIVIPHAVWDVCLVLWVCWLLLVVGGQLVVCLWGPKDKASLHLLLLRLRKCGSWLSKVLRPVVIWAAGENGVFWFNHIDGSLEGDWEFKDPYFPFQTEVEVAQDVGHKLACGDQIRGLPVYARCGSTVKAGIAQLPRGWKRTIPFSAKITSQRNQLKALALCLTGGDSSSYQGTVAVIGTPLRSWMGFGCLGSLYTVYHGARTRLLASRDGPRPPTLVNAQVDLVKYPLPSGMECLDICDCNCTEFYLVTRLGNLIPCVQVEGRFCNTAPLTLAEAKGSSGAPIVCKCRKVKAMFLSCRSSRGVVSSFGVHMVQKDQVADSRVLPCGELVPPNVPRKGQKKVERLVAPTGSGKTTKLPMKYYSDGYSVLVLNPSVATTRSVGEYMKTAHKVNPNIRTGDGCINNGSRLTYSTYGMFLTQPTFQDDVIICDEVHAVDPTTILGIGAALAAFQSSAKAKLLILATATPPGTPITPHPNVTTQDLTDEGDFPFHGRKIKLDNLKKGRHLIFTPGKKHCDTMARDLNDLGINAVAYYRGKDAGVIPREGDVVVVATDALMTGYTGNFDSVYDSCLQVEAHYELNMNPTFSLSIRTKNADAVTRMQRRGRTGRGKQGTYYQVTPHCATHGIVPTANVIEAFDSGLAYYGMTPAEVTKFLSYYKEESMTAAFDCNIQEFAELFMTLGFVEPAILERMKKEAENYTYLYAAQYSEAQACGAQAPNDNKIWRGLKGTAPFPILYDLEEYDNSRCQGSSRAERIASCFQEYFSNGLVTLAGVGLAAAAVFTAIDLLGNVCVKRVYTFTTDSSAARVITPGEPDPTEALEECYNWDGFAENVQRASHWLADKLVEVGRAGGGKLRYERWAVDHVPHVLAAIQYFAGLTCLQDAPALGSVLGFVGGVLSPLPLKANLFLTALGGAFATKLTTQRGAAVFALAGALGAATGSLSLGKVAVNAAATYGAATATCLVVLKLIDGQMPEMSELASLAFNLASPGACIVGAGSALLIAYCTRTESQVWMNRLLAMLHRGTSCEDYFVASTTLRTNIIKVLEQANLWAVFKWLASWLNSQDEDLCTPRGAFMDFFHSVGQVLRLIVEAVRGFLGRVFTVPAIPVLNCDRGYSGLWAGSGIVTSTCGCGAETVWNILEGKAHWVAGPRTCSSWWTGRVPVNNSMVGCPRPRPASWTTMAVNTGFNSYVTYERRGEDVYVTGISSPAQVVEAAVPDLISAVAVDGIQVKPFGGTGWKKVGKFDCRFRRGDKTTDLKLPFKLEPCREPYREVGCPLPDTLRQVSLTERVMSLGKAQPPQKPKPAGSYDGTPAVKKPTVYDSGSDIESPGDLMRQLSKGYGKLKELEKDLPKPVERADPLEVIEVASDDDSSSDAPLVPGKPQKPRKAGKVIVTKALLNPRAPSFVPKKVKLAKGAVPLPCVPRKGETKSVEAYSLLSSSWETASSNDSACSSWSYDWSLPKLVYKGFKRTISAVSTYTFGIMRYKPLVYTTDPSSINERIRKVTIERTRIEFPELKREIQKAKQKVRDLNLRELELEEALALTPNKPAKSAVTGATGKSVKTHPAVVREVYDLLSKGEICRPWNEVNIMPKSEIFVLTPDKPTKKPARIIAYPHLEMRVVEKMVLGEIGPTVVKTVCGQAYGFLSPQERVQRLVSMWNSKDAPCGFTCDTTCFDSTITPEDIAAECEIYEAAAADPQTKARIRTLHTNLYQGGPMMMQGTYVGERHCRASGVFTTSSSNTLTCYLKVSAAARKAGIKDPSFLIAGDDCVCIFESEMDMDKKRLGLFTTYMKQMGAPQGVVPTPYYHLELLDSCSSNVSLAQTTSGQFHYSTRDPKTPLGRISVEGKGFNPLGSMLGYLLANYPAVWVSRVIAVKFLQELASQETPKQITFDWYGNNYTVPVVKIPYIIEAIHGKPCWHIRQYTSREINRTNQALKDLTIRPLRFYKRAARQVVALCRARGGTLRFLADTLLAWVHGRTVTLEPRKVKQARAFKFWEPYEQNLDEDTIRFKMNWLLVAALIGSIMLIWFKG
nr:polyprotein [Rhizomys pruinosus hepacivirus]